MKISWIYALTKVQLVTLLVTHRLDSTGNIDVLRHRLRNFVTENPALFPEHNTTDMPNKEETTPVRPAPTSDHVEPTPDHTAPITNRTETTTPDPTAMLDRIRKWGLCFEGKDPFAFIERIEELKRSYRCADEFLLLGLPEMLRGNSLLWYRNNHEDWTTWDAFCTAFRQKYLPPDYQDQLRQDIQARRQRPGEPFDQYATDLLTMMRRAGGYTTREKARILYNNLHSSYQLYIRSTEATSVTELSTRAAEHEKVLRRQKEEQPPARSIPSSPVAAATYNREECCWRCKQRGHTRLDCKRPPRKFCSRCGRDGVLTRDCHPPSGNAFRAGEPAATARPAPAE